MCGIHIKEMLVLINGNTMKFSYKALQSYFKEPLPSVQELAHALIFHSFEVEEIEGKGDSITMDIKVLPDRAHDAFSHMGMAREIGAVLNIEVVIPEYEAVVGEQVTLSIPKVHDVCRRYQVRKITNILVGESPVWLSSYLETLGQRSINALVDVTNYVLFETGQPVHIFDADKIEGALCVRESTEGEKVTLLDQKEYVLKSGTLVIADEKGILALAGIKGGTKAEVNKETKNIVIEVGNFDPVAIRRTARSLNLLTDAAKRFENDITPELALYGMNMATHYMSQLGGGVCEECIDVYIKPHIQNTVSVSNKEISKCLGVSVDENEIENIFTRLGFIYTKDAHGYTVIPHYTRLDITTSADLIDEIVRIKGYESIPPVLPDFSRNEPINKELYYISLCKKILAQRGLFEISTYAFSKKGDIEVARPLAKDRPALRSNLIDALTEKIQHNEAHKDILGVPILGLFEIGKVFRNGEESLSLAFGVKEGKKGEFMQTVVSALSEVLGDIPEVQNGMCEIDLGEKIQTLVEVSTYGDVFSVPHKDMQFTPWSVFPSSSRDIALFAGEGMTPELLIETISTHAGPLLITKPRLFDSFEKDGKVSYAFRLVFQSYEKTLTDQDIDGPLQEIKNTLISQGCEIR